MFILLLDKYNKLLTILKKGSERILFASLIRIRYAESVNLQIQLKVEKKSVIHCILGLCTSHFLAIETNFQNYLLYLQYTRCDDKYLYLF